MWGSVTWTASLPAGWHRTPPPPPSPSRCSPPWYSEPLWWPRSWRSEILHSRMHCSCSIASSSFIQLWDHLKCLFQQPKSSFKDFYFFSWTSFVVNICLNPIPRASRGQNPNYSMDVRKLSWRVPPSRGTGRSQERQLLQQSSPLSWPHTGTVADLLL